MKIDKRFYALGALISLPIISAAVVFIGNNTGTAAERCNRFWQSADASEECNTALRNAETERLRVNVDRAEEDLRKLKRGY